MYVRLAKRLLDASVASAALLALSPVFAAVAVGIKLDSKGAVFFRQERIGQGLRPFWIYKFRTMVVDAPQKGAALTAGEDPRITTIGRFLRKTKLDELPQLINVLRGEMSLVGPRPEVRRYVEIFRGDYQEILSVRPGITDMASIKYRDEQAELGFAADPEKQYIERILPDKIALAKEYVRRSSLALDLSLIFKTAVRVFVQQGGK